MKRPSLKKAAIATACVACATMFSLDWSEQNGVSLSIESAQARVGRPLTPVSVAGVARRQTRRAVYGAGVVGAGVVGAGAVAAASYYGTTAPYYRSAYYGSGPYAYYGDRSGVGYQDYATRNGFVCQPGTLVKLDDGRMHNCQ